MSSEYAIEVSNLSKCYQIYEKPSDRLKQMLARGRRKYYKEFWALHDVSFAVKKGETIGIIGRNGSGKSTLLQLICGTLNPTTGNIKVQGRVAALLELGSGFNPEFTGRENVFFNAGVLGQSETTTHQKFSAIEAFADIGEFIDQPVKTYSSGMMVRLAFAVIAHVDADILVIDEALAVGDAFFTQKCMRFLREFMQHGTVLFVSHDTGAVINLCNKVIWLDQGRLKAQGKPKTISEHYLAATYNAESVEHSPAKDDTPQEHNEAKPIYDPRWKEINDSTLRNTLEVFTFQAKESNEFGHGAAQIQHVTLTDSEGLPIHQCTGGETVEIHIHIKAVKTLTKPIVGFSLKDRLGQVLFGDNTYLTYRSQDIAIEQDKQFTACFKFQMPILPQGDYSLAAAVATGTQIAHRQEHWIHDALVVRSISSSVSTGLIGIPMQGIRLEKI